MEGLARRPTSKNVAVSNNKKRRISSDANTCWKHALVRNSSSTGAKNKTINAINWLCKTVKHLLIDGLRIFIFLNSLQCMKPIETKSCYNLSNLNRMLLQNTTASPPRQKPTLASLAGWARMDWTKAWDWLDLAGRDSHHPGLLHFSIGDSY